MSEKTPISRGIEISPENLPKIRKEIASRREEFGSASVIDDIRVYREKMIRAELHEDVVDFYSRFDDDERNGRIGS
jgi:hypothetical protein